jgi:hypothetical protein
MKRTLAGRIVDYTRSKKPRLVEPLQPITRSNTYVNATDTFNYMKKDCLVDWFKYRNERVSYSPNDFQCYLFDKGNDFEKEVINYINSYKYPVTSVSSTISTESCKKTQELMKEGAPFIHSAPFVCKTRKTQGVIDLLVRSDYLHMLVSENPLTKEETKIKGQKLSGDYHYVIVDIKFSTIPLKADGRHILNSDNYPAYKCQLCIYNDAIGEIQGYTPNYSYILGRRWCYTRKGERFCDNNCFSKLGVVDYYKVDSDYVFRTKQAVHWVKTAKKNANKWSVSPPTIPELYPNMCVDSGKWNDLKSKIAEELGDITQIWYCGVKQRELAFTKGIKTWRDPSCNADALGINGKRAPVIDRILDINRQDVDKVRPATINSNMYNWRDDLKQGEIFVDFETFVDVFSSNEDLPYQDKTDTIFMIGVYYYNGIGWVYRNFTATESTLQEENRIMNEFMGFLKMLNYPKMWYWHAERMLWSSAENRQYKSRDDWYLTNWADMATLFREEPVVIKDCYKFGLKEVAKAMRKHGLVETQIESKCNSGLSASVMAWTAYETKNWDLLKDIAKYNEFDVKVLHEILTYLRNNH